MKKIAYITGSRADYGLIRNTLIKINNHPDLSLTVIATGMHLMKKYGETIVDIKNDAFSLYTVPAMYTDTPKSIAKFNGELMLGLVNLFDEIKPDMILLVGDRSEMLVAAMTAVYLGIPIAHIHGGELSSTVDDIARHAITKLSNVHFASLPEYAERIIRLGENKKYVYTVGAPGLEQLKEGLFKKEELEQKFKLELLQPFLLVLQHPVSNELADAKKQMIETMEAIIQLKMQSIVFFPNADAGSQKMIDVISQYKDYNFIKIIKHVSQKEFLSLMQYASVLIGNSSSGIIEASSFPIYVLNIGTRQRGRVQSNNVLNVDYNRNAIRFGIEHCLAFQPHQLINPYQRKNTSKDITSILANLELKELLNKRMEY